MLIAISGHFGQEPLLSVVKALEDDFPGSEVGVVEYLSTEPPSIMQIVADIATWHNVFKAAATIFLSQLGKNAADDLWKNKAKLGQILSSATLKPLRSLAEAVTKARSLKPNSSVAIGIPFEGDNHWATSAIIDTADPIQAAWIIANFASNVQATDETVNRLVAKGFRPLGIFSLTLKDDGTWILKWQSEDDGKDHEEIIIK